MPESDFKTTFLVADTDDGEKSLAGAARRVRAVALDSEALKKQLESIRVFVSDLFDAPENDVAMCLESVELRLDITARGEIRIVGAASVEVQGGLALRFVRSA